MEGQDENSVTPVAEGTGETIQNATGIEGETPQVAPVEEAPKEPEKGPVPYDRFYEVNEAKKQAETKQAELEATLQQYQLAMQQQQMARQQPQQPQADPVAEFMQREGIGKEGYVTQEDMAKVLAFAQTQNQRAAEQQQLNQWLASHPDYTGVCVTPTGQASEYLQKALQEDPMLAMRLQKNWDPVVAYTAAKAQEWKNKQTPTPVPTPAPPAPNVVEQIRSAQRAPQSITAAAGAGTIDKVAFIKGLSDTEFQQRKEILKRGGDFYGQLSGSQK